MEIIWHPKGHNLAKYTLLGYDNALLNPVQSLRPYAVIDNTNRHRPVLVALAWTNRGAERKMRAATHTR